MAGMTHDVRELNQYTGVLTAACALCLLFCVAAVNALHGTLRRFV